MLLACAVGIVMVTDDSSATSTFSLSPVDGKDYAVVNADRNGACNVSTEIPVNFKAEKNGSYSLSFNTEEVSFDYLHLIDNLTGADVDLLANPTYSFDARITDYTSRFKLVFATGDNDNSDSFAYISDGQLIINGKGTLQIFDVLGHQLCTFNLTSSTSHLSPPPVCTCFNSPTAMT